MNCKLNYILNYKTDVTPPLQRLKDEFHRVNEEII